MHLIASKRIVTATRTPAALTPLDRASIQAVVNGPSGGTLYHLALSDGARDAYISEKTAQGFTCHVFGYTESFRTIMVTSNVKVD